MALGMSEGKAIKSFINRVDARGMSLQKGRSERNWERSFQIQ